MTKCAAIVGGDKRSLYAARALVRRGFVCRLYGFDNDDECACFGFEKGSCSAPYLLSEALCGAEILLFPVPATKDGVRLHAPLSSGQIMLEELSQLLPENCKVYGGALPPELKKTGKWHDFLEDDRFSAANALPTAESALALAILSYGGVLRGARCLVLGYGKIARALSLRLEAMGAHVTVLARREESRAEAKNAGFEAQDLFSAEAYGKPFQIVFNTVPFPVFGAGAANALPREGVYLELASYPYGTDPEARRILGNRLIPAPGLPGRYSPVYSGELIARMILEEKEQE